MWPSIMKFAAVLAYVEAKQTQRKARKSVDMLHNNLDADVTKSKIICNKQD